MTNPTKPWKLDGFPKRASCRSGVVIPDEVQKAYTAWLETREINPRRGAQRLQADDIRYTAEVPGGSFAAGGAGWQLMCDYDLIAGNWATNEPGRVLFTDMGVVESDDVPDRE